MGFFDFVGDVFSFTSADAEAPGEDSSSKGQETEPRAAVTGGASNKTPASKEKESDEEAKVNKADAKSDSSTDEGHQASGDDEEGGDEEEEEEEDDEPVDPKPKLEAECMKSKQCSADKHHYDECVERVTKAQESDEPSKENCVEEFFHLAHCATACAAPKLFKQLK
ncbi:hypothetical protein BLS_003529 [Venturia inaequalis]|uniref:Cytochrome b-c1 complex subunit 6, mitochondrial n=1 Tax=Venturia inaequalis TaxID=5025 RepID=A0A8H3V9Y0_VENIN|nr:hypothetical protein BLS_003529 [Venturia inaequalis]RDI81679.1 hypothetical protein Vi05172_g8456 [Venturia inaequalis]